MQIEWYFLVLIILGCLIVGFIAGFFTMRAIFTKELQKNPPVNKDMIRAMYMQMGRKPSEKDVNRVMDAMNKYSTNPYTTPKPKKEKKVREQKAK